MSIIYSYPIAAPASSDLFVFSDASSNPKYATRQATLSSIKDALDVVDSLTAGSGISISSSTGDVTIANTGVLSLSSSFGTYISGTNNSSATGAANIGTVDLNAVDGTAVSATRFLSKDNTWDVPPSYSGGSNVGYVPAGGTVGQYLGGDGNWATASGSGTVTGTGTHRILAMWSAGGADIENSIVQQNAAGNALSINADDVYINANITHASDTGTFLGFPASGTFEIQTNGSQKIRCSANDVALQYNGSIKAITTNTGIKISQGLIDTSGDLGTSGQVLSSTGAGVNWINGGSGTVTSVTASSPVASTGGTAPVISLAASGVVAGSYTHSNITVTDKGLVTAASNGVLGYVPVDYAAATTTVTGNNANKAHAYQATPDSTFTCSRAKIMLAGGAPSFSGANSGIAVGIYTRVAAGIGTGAGNVLLGSGVKSIWSSDPYGSITLSPVNPGDLDLVGGVAYVIVVRCIGATGSTGLLGATSVSNVLYGANFASNTAGLPATINSELEVGATTFRPAITLHSV